jgi:hypothetical protein
MLDSDVGTADRVDVIYFVTCRICIIFHAMHPMHLMKFICSWSIRLLFRSRCERDRISVFLLNENIQFVT